MFLCVLNILYLCVVERLQSLFIKGWLVGHKTLAKRELEAVDFFFRCIAGLSLSLTQKLGSAAWAKEWHLAMSHPPTLVVQFCQSGSVRVGLFHGNTVKPELLVGLSSNVARFHSSEKWWKSPHCSQPLSDNQKPLPSCAVPRGSQLCSCRGESWTFRVSRYLNFPTCCGLRFKLL